MNHEKRHRPNIIPLVFALAALASGCASDVDLPAAATDGFDTDCDTVAPPMTSGGDYGEPWMAPDDTDDELLDVGVTTGPMTDIPTVSPDDDPTSWTYDESADAYYRSPTDLEMVDHEWLSPEDLLVIPPGVVLNELSDGDGGIILPIPMHDELLGRPQTGLSFRSLPLDKTGTQLDVPFVEQRWENDCLRRTTLNATFHFYESRGFDPSDIDVDSIVGSTIASPDRDSLAVLGATRDRTFSMRGPYDPSRVPLELGLPLGKTVFHVLSTEYDPNPAAVLANTHSGSLLRRVPSEPLSLSTRSTTRIAPPPPTCFDEILNEDESDVDCGGSCVSCILGQSCTAPGDCATRLCASGVCVSQCADGLDNDADGFADSCDFSCVEHPDFGTLDVIHSTPLEHAKTIGQFGTMHYCTLNEAAYLASFVEWSWTGLHILNNVVPHDPTLSYEQGDGPPPFRVAMRGCVIADDSAVAAACDTQTNDCPSQFQGYPLALVSTSNWGTASTGSLGTATGVLGQAWNLVAYTAENGTVSDTVPLNIVLAYPLDKDDSQAENGVAVEYRGPNTPRTSGSIVSYWGNTFAGFNFAHEVGHTLGLAHETAGEMEGSFYPGTNKRGFMTAPIAGPAPVLDWDANSAIPALSQWDQWLSSGSKEVPRPSGFVYQGCDNNDLVCENGHPGLLCDGGSQTCRKP